ncbi:hypothetical protein WME77_19215 [Sorangium sp. So ce764]|uniref:hypothetical protein n=1 Tax=Sorangium sp. So ce764 TaxID=3133320 RepID=UPI003F5D9EFD
MKHSSKWWSVILCAIGKSGYSRPMVDKYSQEWPPLAQENRKHQGACMQHSRRCHRPAAMLLVLVACSVVWFGCGEQSGAFVSREKRTIALGRPYSVAELASNMSSGVEVVGFDVLLDGGRVETLALKPYTRNAVEMVSQFSTAHAEHVELMVRLFGGPVPADDSEYAQLRAKEAQAMTESLGQTRDPENMMVNRVTLVGEPSLLEKTIKSLAAQEND